MITKIKMCKLLQKEISNSNPRNSSIHHWSKTFPLLCAKFKNPKSINPNSKNSKFIYPIYRSPKSNFQNFGITPKMCKIKINHRLARSMPKTKFL
jgi:hypothetical protein